MHILLLTGFIMRIARNWKDYKILDTGNGEKVEVWGKYVLKRPDPQAIWPRTLSDKELPHINGIYHRSNKGGGFWENKGLPDEWSISYDAASSPLTFRLKPFSFKHTGLFPEQAVNWDEMSLLVKNANRPIKVLNLFAYTGGATLALVSSGAEVTHVDASKGMVKWAKENAMYSGLAEKKARYIVDDCVKFVQREIRRKNHYDAILLDPPSYGRGPKGEIWKFEENIYALIELLTKLLSDDPLFFILNSYTTGLQPLCLEYMLGKVFNPIRKVKIDADELGLEVEATKLILPCGSCGKVTFI